MDLIYDDEEEMWQMGKEPYCTIVCETKEDFELILKMRDFWYEHHEKKECE